MASNDTSLPPPQPPDPIHSLIHQPEAPKGKNLKAQAWFLTFPQVETPKQTVLDLLKKRFPDTRKAALLAQEKHQDGKCD